jgi:hypothetical protein
MGCKSILITLSSCCLLALGCSSAAGDDDSGNGMQMQQPVVPGGMAGSVAPGNSMVPGNPMATTPPQGMVGNTMPPTTTPMGGSGDVTPPMTVAGAGGSMAEPMAGSMAEPMAGSMAPPTATHVQPCLTKGSQLALIGDSYIEYINSLTPLLEARATKEGALKQGDHYDNQAVPGSSLAVGLILIPPQWDAAKKASNNDIQYVVMDGGGNDVLLYNMQCLADGSAQDPGCQQVSDDATKVAKEMMMDMKATGVKDVIYFFYPHVPAGGQDILDNYSGPKAKENCEGNNATDPDFHCHFVSLVDAFEGHPDYISGDGIHPSPAGAEVQADVIWKAMKDNCVGQASGCCSM